MKKPPPQTELISCNKPRHVLRVDGPALVIGGGPSVPADLAELSGIEFAIIISANAHGVVAHRQGLIPRRPDYLVVGDQTHSETRQPQGPTMRAHGIPIIARHDFADYRLDKRSRRWDAGQTAIWAACLMGASPVYPVGFNCWQGAATYWHDRDADVVCRRQGGHRIPQQLPELAEACKAFDVRPVSGPLLSAFPTA